MTRFDQNLDGIEESALEDLLRFPCVDALFGRRSRRFFLGAEVPDGPLAYKSRPEPVGLSETERLLILTAVGGNTGWHNSITRHDRYAPLLANYPTTRAAPAAAPSLGRGLPHRRDRVHR